MMREKFGKIISLIFGFVFCCNFIIAQNDTIQLQAVFSGNFKIYYSTKDNLGNWYFVDSLFSIKKYRQDGKLLANYDNTRFGDVTSIDATNPFQVFTFYQPQQKVIQLDNTLNEIVAINLQNFDLYDVRVACRSNDNQLWVFDAYRYQLIKKSIQGETIVESIPIETYIGKSILPTFLIERNNKVFIGVENYGLLVFDNFGKYLQTILLSNAKNFKIDDEFILFSKNGNSYILETNQFNIELLPTSTISNEYIRYHNNIIINENHSFSVYNISKH